MTQSRFVRLVALSLLVSLAGRWPAHGAEPEQQQAPAEKNVTILTVGGFLGQLDGFCEHPGGTYDLEWFKNGPAEPCPDADGKTIRADGRKALGGLLGAKSWIEQQRAKAKQPFLIVAGNNQVGNFTGVDKAFVAAPPPPAAGAQMRDQVRVQQAQTKLASFWSELASMNPTAVGMGPEDFVRSLRLPLERTSRRPVDPAIVFTEWIDDVTMKGSGLPLIASNVIVLSRNRRLGDLNDVSKAGFSLAVDKDSTIAWGSTLTVNHPASAGLTFELCDRGANPPACQPVQQPKTADDTSTELPVAGGSLLPGHAYAVVVTDQITRHRYELTFRTHAALTPRVTNVPYLTGFPVVGLPGANDADLLIVSLVGTEVKATLGSPARTWKGDRCAADECEIDVLPPTDTMKLLLERTIAAKRKKPFIVLISALNDSDTLDLLDTYPEIRAVVLPPDSRLLGRASRSRPEDPKDLVGNTFYARSPAGQRYSGDQGLSSVVNGGQPPATLLVARPEWVGETAARLGAKVWFDGSEWLVDDEEAAIEPVGGAALHWHVASCGYMEAPGAMCVFYDMRWGGRIYSYGSYDRYADCPAQTIVDECTLLRTLATDEDQFGTFAGDALRQTIKAELAFVPDDLLDYDVGGWLNELLPAGAARPSLDMLSRLILERGIYRSFRYVKTSIAGDKIIDTLDKMLKSGVVGGSGCVTGVQGKACARSINTKKPETVTINGRTVDSRLYYSIALPDAVAEALALPHDDDESDARDAMEILHDQLLSRAWYVADTQATLSERLLDRGRKRPQMNLITSALEVGFTEGLLPSLDGREGTLKGLDVEFRSITASKTVIAKSAIDLAVFDTTRFAVRGIASLDLNRKTDTIKRTRDVTYSSNSWLFGGRVDVYKIQAFNREFRPYVGLFREGEVEREPQFFTASFNDSVGGFRTTTSATAPTPFRQPPLQFNYKAGGVDILNAVKFKGIAWPWLAVDITRLTAQYAHGTLRNVPVGIIIDDTVQGPEAYDLFLTSGAGAVLNDYFRKNTATFNPNVQFSAQPGEPSQRRVQLEADLEPRLTFGARVYKFGTDVRYRRYVDLPDTVRLNLQQSLRLRFRLTIPLYWRFEFVPNFEYHRATIKTDSMPIDSVFRYRKFEATLRLPFVARAGWGWLFQ